MLPPLVVLWLAAPAAQPEYREEIAAWASQRGYRPVAPEASPRAPYDAAAALQIEALLEDAQTSAPGSASVFEQLDRLLAEHPELPQAGWLLAERYALEARELARHGAPTGGPAEELTLRSSALEGSRAPAFGSEAAVPSALPERQPLELLGARPEDEVSIDGSPLSRGRQLAAGRHHVQLLRAHTSVWAGWVDVGSPARVQVPDPSRACQEFDLLDTDLTAHAPAPAPGVLCERWAVASPDASGGLRVSLCQGSRCGAWEVLRQGEPGRGGGAEAPVAERNGLPGWVTWGAVGLG
ncbi:MAG TPA: hypothetical protein VJU61_27310, partial [Polyangiaceae bacterium]|nr:hypothetical protein [Polyangiaceae bacterium]